MIWLIGRMLDSPWIRELLMLMTTHLQVNTLKLILLPPCCSLYARKRHSEKEKEREKERESRDAKVQVRETPCSRSECLMLAQANNSKLPVDTPRPVSLLTLALYVMALIAR